MKKTKLIVIVSTVVVLVVITGLSAWRIASLSAEYPNPQIYENGVGDEVKGGDIGITAIGARILNSQQIEELIPGFDSGLLDDSGKPISKESVKMLVVELDVTNYSSTEQAVALYKFTAVSRAWSNGVSLDSFRELNEGNSPTLAMSANQSQTVCLPFLLYDFQFQSKTDWDTVSDRPFDLALSLYPIKTVIHLLNENA
jgi:hypothetical protein